MRMLRFVAVLAALVLVLAACGQDPAAEDPNAEAPEDDVTLPAEDRGADLDDAVAAVVDGEEISAAAVQEQVDALAANPKIAEALDGLDSNQAVAVLRAQVVSTIILNHVAAQSADELGAPVTDDDIAEARAELEQETGGPEGLQQALQAEGMSEEQLTSQLRALAALRNIEVALAENQGEEQEETDDETRAQQFLTERIQAADVVVNDAYGTWDPQSGQVTPMGDIPQAPQQPVPDPQS